MRYAIVCLLVACAAHAPTAAPALTNTGSDDECGSDDGFGGRDIAVYCHHVKDRCCEPYGWNCDNAQYIGAWATYCASR
ncbi:MAG TPA: hypothetical protein VGG28_15100 [Kofleriaceae bacterium]|jgi:hypothetical protein